MTTTPTPLAALIDSVAPVDATAAAAAEARHLELTKPPGSLGRLEAVGARLAAIAGRVDPPSPTPAVVAVFAGDHGVHAEGVSPWPQEVTAQMIANFCGGGAAINAIARANGLRVAVVNAGVATPVADHPDLRNTPVRAGTDNLRLGPAMSVDDAMSAVSLGAEVAAAEVAAGARCLLTGDMGIANTTPSAAVIAVAAGVDVTAITGRGTGIDDETLTLKRAVLADAVGRAGAVTGLDLAAELGGLEIAALAGYCLGGAVARVPVIVDGVIALAGAVLAHQLQPLVGGYLIAGHRSVEPAATTALDHLGLEPLVDLDLRLGEGTGAALAHPLVVAAVEVLNTMATFAEAAVAGQEDDR
ncbi:MAG: nicotinate-nucleotide--dimethylbenzimidazole phosphoribosyltransferase [Actinomycetota bacterium]